MLLNSFSNSILNILVILYKIELLILTILEQCANLANVYRNTLVGNSSGFEKKITVENFRFSSKFTYYFPHSKYLQCKNISTPFLSDRITVCSIYPLVRDTHKKECFKHRFLYIKLFI